MAVFKKNSNFQYRKAERSDIETLTELLCELYENHSYEELLVENKGLLDNRQQVLFLAFDGTKPIGVCHGALRSKYVNGKEYAGTAGYLEAIYVRSEYRFCGAAVSLVGLCEEWARYHGCREFLSDCLLANTESYKFHLRIGFAETERCIFFKKDLAPLVQNDKVSADNATYEKTRSFIYRNARPLDFARWKCHFENGSKEAVLTALAAYQNEDGGFGHALEADAWNPNSAPMQTWTATEILREIDFADATHPIIQGILQYLESGQGFTGKFWDNAPSSNNDYPHAPWWQTDSNSACHHSYNPTACLAGFIIRFAERNSDLYRTGCRIAKEAYDAYFGQNLLGDMHTASCYIRLWQYCEEAGATDIIDLSALKERLREQVRHGITKNTAEWETGYICKPSQFFNNHNSTFYADNKDIAEYECRFIIKSQLYDGSWMIPWGWNGYPEEWAISKNWWKGNGAILNLLYLKGMGRLTK